MSHQAMEPELDMRLDEMLDGLIVASAEIWKVAHTLDTGKEQKTSTAVETNHSVQKRWVETPTHLNAMVEANAKEQLADVKHNNFVPELPVIPQKEAEQQLPAVPKEDVITQSTLATQTVEITSSAVATQTGAMPGPSTSAKNGIVPQKKPMPKSPLAMKFAAALRSPMAKKTAGVHRLRKKPEACTCPVCDSEMSDSSEDQELVIKMSTQMFEELTPIICKQVAEKIAEIERESDDFEEKSCRIACCKEFISQIKNQNKRRKQPQQPLFDRNEWLTYIVAHKVSEVEEYLQRQCERRVAEEKYFRRLNRRE